ncbi:unannotated protein [freshwater metagenome]|uniref:Unannotated protein n=1 Tax=freshwater metagenome TaxID=449393 RepID=A0A6J6DZB6_9ZZZZ
MSGEYKADVMPDAKVSPPTSRPSLAGRGFSSRSANIVAICAATSSGVPLKGQSVCSRHHSIQLPSAISKPAAWPGDSTPSADGSTAPSSTM